MEEGRSIGREQGSQHKMGSGRVAAVAVAAGDDNIEVAAAATVAVASSSGQHDDDANGGAQQVNVLSRVIPSPFAFPFCVQKQAIAGYQVNWLSKIGDAPISGQLVLRWLIYVRSN
jgi:hypothetical protein